MKADLVHHSKLTMRDGAIVEMRIWRVPTAVKGSDHRLKYSLFYGMPGDRIVAYDNESGKGDHRHLGSDETAYDFTTVEQLIEDFKADVRRARGEP